MYRKLDLVSLLLLHSAANDFPYYNHQHDDISTNIAFSVLVSFT